MNLLHSQVAWPEVVAPLADAMGFVDSEQRDSGLSEALGSASRVESLRCDVQQLDFAVVHAGKPVRDLSRGERAVDESSGQPPRGQRVDLIFHQRDEWRHYHGQAGKNQRGHLKAERLSAAGG